MTNTCEFPFGEEDASTLIICHGETHRKLVIRALSIKGHYVLWGQALMGRRYNKIIVFSSIELTQDQIMWTQVCLPTLLTTDHLEDLYLL